MQTSWTLRYENQPEVQEDLVSDLSLSLDLSPLTVRLLLGRGCSTARDIEEYLNPRIEHLADPFLVPGIPSAVQLVRKHLTLQSPIAIHGDYDVDGITASAVLTRVFRRLGADSHVFLPHRIHDGYGLTRAGLEFAKKKGAKLLITVDCGITAFDIIEEARAAGMDVIVTDHHQISPRGLPSASAIIHPLIDPSGEAFKELSAVGLAFKLACALIGDEARELLDLVSLGTVADVAPLAGENRIFVKYGLEKCREGRNLGIKALAEAAKLRGRWSAMHLGFNIGPRINASGRLDSPDIALALLTSQHEKEARSLAAILEAENKRRQRIEREAVKQAVEKVEREFNFSRDRVIVVWDERWHPGVIGIMASRLVDKFYRPAIVISLDENKLGRGSARSIRHFNIFNALNDVSGCLMEHGGHEQAAGFKIKADQLEAFREAINQNAVLELDAEHLVKSYEVEAELKLSELTRKFVEELDRFEPFGAGNPKPVFLTRRLLVKGKPSTLGTGQHGQAAGGGLVGQARAVGTGHLKFWVSDGETTFEALWFNARPFDWGHESFIDIVYTPDSRTWDGQTFPVLAIKDIKFS